MRIFLAGATGVVGRPLVPALLGAGHEVTALARTREKAKALEAQGAEPAYRLVRDELRRTPTLLGLDKLLEAQLIGAPLERRRDLELMKELVNQHTRSLAMYKCDNCGFRARPYYWHSPACASWETYSPRRTEETAVPA